MMEMHVDTLEPPKFKHKRVPKSNGSPHVPVRHSHPRPVTVKDQQDWKIPSCISKWKNPKEYTIPLDKRSTADARGLQEVQINANFVKLSEALYVVEQKAREAVATRSKLQKDLMMKEKEQKEELKAKREDRMKREKIHKERRRERENERRFEAKDAAMGKKRIHRKLIRNWEKKPTLLVTGKRRGDAPTSYSTSRGVGEKDDGKRKGDDIGTRIKDQENEVLKALYFGKTQRSIDLKVFGGLSLPVVPKQIKSKNGNGGRLSTSGTRDMEVSFSAVVATVVKAQPEGLYGY
nr:SNW/SKI-interacting protein-like [Tanacetum cinerariifolium]